MHLGNGAVTPACAAVGYSAAAAGLTLAAILRPRDWDARRIASAGVLGAAIFAAQAVNVPVLGFCSAHLVGGVLAAWVLGPSLGAITMSIVLLMQAMLLGDGGLMALGWNIVNMALLPAVIVAFAARIPAAMKSSLARTCAIGTTAGLAVLLAAWLVVGQVALFRSSTQLHGLGAFAWQMTWTHAWISLGEALVTVGALGLLGSVSQPGVQRLSRIKLAVLGAVAMVLAGLILPWASAMPDGYEAALEHSRMIGVVESITGFNQTVNTWQYAIVDWMPMAGIGMAMAATVVAGLLVWSLASLLGQLGGRTRTA